MTGHKAVARLAPVTLRGPAESDTRGAIYREQRLGLAAVLVGVAAEPQPDGIMSDQQGLEFVDEFRLAGGQDLTLLSGRCEV